MMTIYRGETKSWRLTVTLDGVAQSLAGCTLHARVKRQLEDDATVMAKVSTDPTEIQILTQSGATLGQALLHSVPVDTQDLDPGTYLLDVWLIDAGGAQVVLLPPHPLGVRRTVTELP